MNGRSHFRYKSKEHAGKKAEDRQSQRTIAPSYNFRAHFRFLLLFHLLGHFVL